MSHKRTYRIEALGCRTNQYEAQALRDQLESAGYTAAQAEETADLCIVNTCTVTAGADKDSRRLARRFARKNPGSRVVVTGCAVEGQQAAFKEIEGVSDLVLNKDKERLLELLYPEEQWPEFSIRHFDAHTRAFVKVQDGCNSFCTYCIIPYVRGRSRSRTMTEILGEVKDLVANGYREIVLTGINIGDFDGGGGENSARLVDLVRAVDAIEGVERLRISSIDPDEVDDELLDAVLNGRSTCHSMHIVLQAGSNVVLKRMNRKYNRQEFLDSVERVYKASPDFTITTDIIVGFPGETEADFQETKEVVQEVQFAKVHMFPFSPRERTRAALLPNPVPPDVMRTRKQELLRLAEHESLRLRDRFIGREMRVLTENNAHGQTTGHTDNFLPVILSNTTIKSNLLVNVKLVENTPEGLIGRRID